MLPERKIHALEQKSIDFVVKHLTNDQLLILVGQEEYKNYQDKILQRLQLISGFGLINFRRVHTSVGCIIKELETGKNILISGVDINFSKFSGKASIKRLVCATHNATSTEFFTYYGLTQEFPF